MTEYSKSNPFHAQILERKVLNKPGSTKKTFHLRLDLTGSGIEYKVGDCIGILPHNPPSIVEQIVQHTLIDPNAIVEDLRSQTSLPFKHFLTTKLNLTRVTTPFLKILASKDPKSDLHPLFQNENKAQRIQHLATYDLLDHVKKYSDLKWNPQDFTHLPPLLPRFYSIASSQHLLTNAVDLLIVTFGGGVASDYLCFDAETTVPLYLHPTRDFTLPSDPNTPIIMIGPGTGVAPYRGFLQERTYLNAPGKNWLFFGERNRATDFYYEDELSAFTNLKADFAFSRDQADKIYVQHKLHENGPEVWKWLEDGAYVYVCGDAKHMAHDVNHTLLEIIEKHGRQDGKAYLKDMRKEKRYLLDVY